MIIDLEKVNNDLVATFNNPIDLVSRKIRTPYLTADLVFIDAMVDSRQLDDAIIAPLINYNKAVCADLEGINGVLTCNCKISATEDYEGIIRSIASGNCALLIDKAKQFIILDTRKSNGRNVQEPPTTSVIKGPREGFVEDIKTNVVLLRRKLRSCNLVFEKFNIGRFSDTTVFVSYLKNVAMEDVLIRIKERISTIDIDGITDSSAISKFLETKVYSIFKQVGNSEKPDVIAAKLLEGKIAIIVDGSPIVLVLPFVLMDDFDDVQDNYKRPSRASFLRIIRLIGVVFAVILPSFYVAVQIYDYQMIPPQMLVTLLNATEGLPFSPTLEMIVAIVLFEILGEASIRMPRFIGMALSVVGAIILGETAVKAGVLSSVTVMVVALSGIGIYAVPDEVGTFSILRIVFVLIAGVLGIFGILITLLTIFAYLVDFEGYGVPYMTPLAPLIKKDLLDGVLKISLTESPNRPQYLNLDNKTKQKIKE